MSDTQQEALPETERGVITPELQAVFGRFGTVRGLVVNQNGLIDVEYEEGDLVFTFFPYAAPKKNGG